MILALALACSDYGFDGRVEPVEGDSGVPATAAPDSGDDPAPPGPADDPGLRSGHFDVDTTTTLDGPTEGHFHEYDDEHDVSGIDFVAPLDTQGEVQPLAEALGETPDLPFVITVTNADLSPGARLAIGRAYDPQDPSSWVPVTAYGDVPVEDLEQHTLRSLPSLGVYFAADAIAQQGLVGTEPPCVMRNDPGPEGEWRNGALVVQAIRADVRQTDPSRSAGGHGPARAGLLWEGILFWHWPNGTCR